jgi:hypothetical protein
MIEMRNVSRVETSAQAFPVAAAFAGDALLPSSIASRSTLHLFLVDVFVSNQL